MDFRLVNNQEEWDDFVSRQEFSQFLQSWSWGEFQKAYGRRVWRVGFFDNDQMVGAAQIIEHYLGLGMGYLYCPRGPVTQFPISNFQFPIKDLFDFIKTKMANYGTLFLRIEPNLGFGVQGMGYRIEKAGSIQPAHILMLDLSKSEDELLAAMHPKTRYNIRLAERKGLEFENVILTPQNAGEESFSHFWKLLQETARRDKIRLHPRKYYELMLQNVTCYMLHVTCFKNLLATGLFIGFGNTFSYVHGASSSQHREMMAPYFLHWQAIKFAKSQGYRYYDFGGINPPDKSDFDYRPSWEGLTRFKKGFGGFIHSYQGTHDIILNEWGYRFYRLARRFNF